MQFLITIGQLLDNVQLLFVVIRYQGMNWNTMYYVIYHDKVLLRKQKIGNFVIPFQVSKYFVWKHAHYEGMNLVLFPSKYYHE